MFHWTTPFTKPMPAMDMPLGIAPASRNPLAKAPTLETPRLLLRRWESQDVLPYVNLCRDPQVMCYFNGLMSPIACFEEIERQEVCFDTYGYGLWVVELKSTGEFVGTVGIEPTMMRPKGMTARMAWKLSPAFWGRNYAYEAGKAISAYAFDTLKVSKIIALVEPGNVRSIRLMKRLGLDWNGKTRDFFVKAAA